MSHKHSEKFKAQMLLLKQSGRKERELSMTYNLGHSTISRWEKEFEKSQSESHDSFQPLSESHYNDKRIEELGIEVETLKEELDILKAAVSLLCKKKS